MGGLNLLVTITRLKSLASTDQLLSERLFPNRHASRGLPSDLVNYFHSLWNVRGMNTELAETMIFSYSIYPSRQWAFCNWGPLTTETPNSDAVLLMNLHPQMIPVFEWHEGAGRLISPNFAVGYISLGIIGWISLTDCLDSLRGKGKCSSEFAELYDKVRCTTSENFVKENISCRYSTDLASASGCESGLVI